MVISLPLAVLLTSSIRLKALIRGIIFFPVLVSTVAVGITFATLMQPSTGLINNGPRRHRAAAARLAGQPQPRAVFGGDGGYMEGRRHRDGDIHCRHPSIPLDYFDAARLEGGAWVKFRHVILPLSRNATSR